MLLHATKNDLADVFTEVSRGIDSCSGWWRPTWTSHNRPASN